MPCIFFLYYAKLIVKFIAKIKYTSVVKFLLRNEFDIVLKVFKKFLNEEINILY